MKLRKIAKNALGALMSVALVSVMLTSCSKGGGSGKLIENIPASACFVMKANPQQIVENAGCTVENGKIVLSDVYSEAIRKIEPMAVSMVNTYLAYTEGVDLSSMMVFFTDFKNGEDVTFVALANDPAKVAENLKNFFGEGKERDGFTTFQIDGSDGVIALKDNFIWVAAKMKYINRHIEDAQQASLATLSGVAEFLTGDDAMAYMISLPKIKEMADSYGKSLEEELRDEGVPTSLADKIVDVFNYYACFSVKLDGNTLSGQAYLVDENGKRNEFGKMLNEIDPAFLANVPANTNSIMAFGNIADEDIKNLMKNEADKMRDRRYRADEVAVLDFLTAWDGTAAMAIDATGLNVNLNTLVDMNEMELATFVMQNIKMVAMAHLPADLIQNYTNTICTMLESTNQTYDTLGNGYYSVAIQDVNVTGYFGEKDGYFVVGNSNGEGASDLTGLFAGKRAVLYGKQDANPTLAECGWNFGSEGSAWVEDDAIKFNLSLTGTSLNFLQAFLEPLTDAKNLQNMADLVEKLERSGRYGYDDYGYDYDYDYNY